MNQNSRISGDGNTIVQIVGNDNEVTFGRPYLVLTQFASRRRISSDLSKLDPCSRSISLIGREAELASLHGFLNSDRFMSVRVLIGGGGSGKTRLALELCEKAQTNGWSAGFITSDELARFFDQQNLSTWGWNKPTLMVVDYAAQHAQQLRSWLDELSNRAESSQHPLRLLLLERHANSNDGWWNKVFLSGGWGALAKQELLDPAEPIQIPPLTEENRLTLLQSMLEQTAPSLNIQLPANDEAFRAKLMQLTWGGDPLFLMMAALEMVKVGHADVLTLGRTELAHKLAERELDRLAKQAEARNINPELVKHLAACITLSQGISHAACQDFATKEKEAIGRPSGGDPAELADLLREALPDTNGIAPVIPDLIGEALVLRILPPDDRGIGTVLRCYTEFGSSVAQSVIRCVQDFAPDRGQPLQWIEAIIRAAKDDEKALSALDTSLPLYSAALRDINMKVASFLCAARTKNRDVTMQDRAAALHSLSLAQLMGGQNDWGLQPMQEAVALYRQLADKMPDEFTRKLAMALGNLANILNQQNEPDTVAALNTAKEATNLYRELNRNQPDSFRGKLALSFSIQAIILCKIHSFDAGQCEQAVSMLQEAIATYRKLAAEEPEEYLSELASAVNNFAYIQYRLGQFEFALPDAQESVDLFRQLVAKSPDESRFELARSLSNQAKILFSLGRHEEAYQTGKEAVGILRKLAALRPSGFENELVESLCNLIDICRKLFVANPEAFRPELAELLNEKAMCMGNLGAYKEALLAIQEAVPLFRELDAKAPDLFRLRLAGVLNNLSLMLSATDNTEAALEFAHEAINIRDTLTPQQLDVFRPDLAKTLNNMANMLRDLGEKELALQKQEEAVQIIRELTAQQPDKYKFELAMFLRNLAINLRAAGRLQPTLQNVEECIKIFRELNSLKVDIAFQSELAQSLTEMMATLFDLARHQEALKVAQEALDIYRELVTQRPDQLTPKLAGSLNNVALVLSKFGQPDMALKAELEAAEIRRELAIRHPEVFLPELADSLNYLTDRLRKLGQRKTAQKVAEEAVGIYRELVVKNPFKYQSALAMSLMDVAITILEKDPSEINLITMHAEEAIATLKPIFLDAPHVHHKFMWQLLANYSRMHKEFGTNLDMELLKATLNKP